MNQKLLGFFAVLALAAPVSGCLTNGELGGGSFGYLCTNQGNDAACDSSFSGQELSLPRKVAVGSVFDIVFHGDSASPSSFLPDSASSEILQPSGTSFQFVKPGFAAVLARSVDGRIGDFVHLRGADIDHLSVLRITTQITTLKLSVGQAVSLQAVPTDASNETLAGALTYTWGIKGDAGILDVTAETETSGAPKSNAVVVTGQAAGSVDLTVQTQSKTATVHVTVGG